MPCAHLLGDSGDGPITFKLQPYAPIAIAYAHPGHLVSSPAFRSLRNIRNVPQSSANEEITHRDHYQNETLLLEKQDEYSAIASSCYV